MMQETHSNGIPLWEHQNQDEARTADTAHKPDSTPELGGRGGLEPTRYGDWEKNGRCIDF